MIELGKMSPSPEAPPRPATMETKDDREVVVINQTQNPKLTCDQIAQIVAIVACGIFAVAGVGAIVAGAFSLFGVYSHFVIGCGVVIIVAAGVAAGQSGRIICIGGQAEQNKIYREQNQEHDRLNTAQGEQVKRLGGENTRLTGQVDEIIVQVESLREEKDQLAEQNTLLIGQVDQFTVQVEKQALVNAELETNVDELNAQVGVFTLQVDTFERENKELTAQVDALELVKTGLEKQTISLEQKVTSFHGGLKKFDSIISEFSEEAEESVEDLSDEVQKLEVFGNNIRKIFEQSAAKREGMKQQAEALLKQISELQEGLAMIAGGIRDFPSLQKKYKASQEALLTRQEEINTQEEGLLKKNQEMNVQEEELLAKEKKMQKQTELLLDRLTVVTEELETASEKARQAKERIGVRLSVFRDSALKVLPEEQHHLIDKIYQSLKASESA